MLANSEDPDQNPHSVASDLGLHYFPMSHKRNKIIRSAYLHTHVKHNP